VTREQVGREGRERRQGGGGQEQRGEGERRQEISPPQSFVKVGAYAHRLQPHSTPLGLP